MSMSGYSQIALASYVMLISCDSFDFTMVRANVENDIQKELRAFRVRGFQRKLEVGMES